MKWLIMSLLLTGCAEPQRGEIGVPGQTGADCKVYQLSYGAVIQCGDTNAIILNGRDSKHDKDND